MSAVEKVAQTQLRENLPQFHPGDTLRVHVKIKEGDKERVQPFEGVVIARRGRGIQKTFTLRRISFGVGVERIFPLHSPTLQNIEVIRSGKVLRAKLHYLRDTKGKNATRIKEKTRKVKVEAPSAQ